jgi:hypothetical protein
LSLSASAAFQRLHQSMPGSVAESQPLAKARVVAFQVRTPAGHDRWDAKQVSRLLAA